LSDFGLSKGALSTSVGLTGVGQFLGTVDYISPEQIEGKPVDGRADEYALACATFEMLTGAPPFRRDEAMAVMYAQLSEPPPLVTSQRPDLPPAADQVFARALAKAPAQRYASCREFADALRGAFGLAPYDSGPGVIPAAGHQPTQIAWPAAGVTAAAAGPAAGAGMPTSEAAMPSSLAAATVPGHLGPDTGDGDGPAPGGRRRRLSPVTLAGISALALAGIAAAVMFAISPGHGPVSYSKHAGSPTPTVTQATKAAPSKTPRATVTPTAAPPVTVPATTAPPTTPPPTTAPPTTPPPTTASPTTTPSATVSPTASPASTGGTSG
jgi:hypothetical protein